MSTVHIDIADGAVARYTKDGWQDVKRIAHVLGLSGTPSERQKTALDALLAQEDVDIDDEHPTIPNCAVTSHDVRLVADTNGEMVVITINYEMRQDTDQPPARMTVRAGLTQETVNTDADGNLMTVEYDGKTQSGSTSAPIPIHTITIRTWLPYVPYAFQSDFQGRMNSAPWALVPGSLAHEWLCSEVTSGEWDGELAWIELVWVFERVCGNRTDFTADGPVEHTMTHDKQVTYLDPETGRVPELVSDAEKAAAIKIFEVTKDIDFNDLAFLWPNLIPVP